MTYLLRTCRCVILVFTYLITTAVPTYGDEFGVQKDNAEPSAIDVFSVREGKSTPCKDLKIDRSGFPWLLADNHVYFFNGQAFERVPREQLSSSRYTDKLFGGPDRGLYLTQADNRDFRGQIFRLDAGKEKRFEEVTSFYYDTATWPSRVFVSQDGRLFNWGERFLAVFDGQTWKRIEAKFAPVSSSNRPVIVDLGDNVYFYSSLSNTVYQADDASVLSSTDGPDSIAKAIATNNRSDRRRRVTAMPWGESRVLLYFERPSELFAFDVKTNQTVELRQVNELESFRKLRVSKFGVRQDGSVWMFPWYRAQNDHFVWTLSPEGDIAKLKGDSMLDPHRDWRHTHSANLPETKEKDVVVGLKSDGLTIVSEGVSKHLGWRQGFTKTPKAISIGLNNDIWVAGSYVNGDVVRINWDNQPPAIEPMFADWSDWELVPGSRVYQFGAEEIALFRADQPHHLSRWKDGKWTHQRIPINAVKILRVVQDDLRNLLVLASGSGNTRSTFMIGSTDVTQYQSLNEMLTAAIESGATKFDGGPHYAGFVREDNGKLWYASDRSSTLQMFDGKLWSELTFPPGVQNLFRSSKHGAIFKTGSNKFYRYNIGQFEKVEFDRVEAQTQMIVGSKSQLYDEPIAKASDKPLFILGSRSEKRLLFFDHESFKRAMLLHKETSRDEELPELGGVVMPHDLGRWGTSWKQSPDEGAWAFASGKLYRVKAASIKQIDFSGTPLTANLVQDVAETAGDGLWFKIRRSRKEHLLKLRQPKLLLDDNVLKK